MVRLYSRLYLLFWLLILGLLLYGFILFVKTARRMIKALDIYINEHSEKPKL